MKKRIAVLVGAFAAIFLLSSVLVSAQYQDQRSPQPRSDRQAQPPRPTDPLDDVMFPPEMVMQHQRELGLSDEQRNFMVAETNRTSTRFNELQWQLHDAMEALHEALKATPVNEQLALSQLDKVLENEREMKRAHMELGIRIKNKLTPEQQIKLQSIRRPHPPGDGQGPGGPGGPGRGPGRGPGGPGQRPDGPGQGPGGPGQGPGQDPGPGGPGQRPPGGIR